MAWTEDQISQLRSEVCGIYKITSPTNRVYIGKSKNVNARIRQHMGCPEKKILRRKNVEPILINSLLKYGVESHKFEIIQVCPIDHLNYYEIYYIWLYDSCNTENGMNCTRGGDGAMPGLKLTDEWKRKIGNAQRGSKNHRWGKKLSPEEKEKLRIAGIGNKSTSGQKQSEETIAKRVAKITGLKRTPETLEKMRQAHLGQVVTEEMRKKNSMAHKGVKLSEAHKEKCRKAMIGRIVSEETRRKIGNANRGRTFPDEITCSKIIMNTQNGIFYYGLKSASFSVGIVRQTLSAKLSGISFNNTYLIYV